MRVRWMGMVLTGLFVLIAQASGAKPLNESEVGKATPKLAGPGFSLQKSVVGGGGGRTSGPNHSLNGTVGQPAVQLIATVPKPGKTVCSGFWCVEFPGLVDAPVPELPVKIDFGLPHPNPANGNMRLPFALPHEARVDVYLIDVTGRRVQSLAGERFEPGRHTVSWDGRDTEGRQVRAGVYFMRIMLDGRDAGRRQVVVVR